MTAMAMCAFSSPYLMQASERYAEGRATVSHKVSRTDGAGANAKALDPISLDELALVFAQAAVDSFFQEQHSKDMHTRTAPRADPDAFSISAAGGFDPEGRRR